jgi:hypothetical protein
MRGDQKEDKQTRQNEIYRKYKTVRDLGEIKFVIVQFGL